MAKGFTRQSRCSHTQGTFRCALSMGHTGVCRASGGVTWHAQDTPPDNAHLCLEQVTGPLYSWRWWRPGPRATLKSITSDTVWYTKRMTTTKRHDGTLLPVSFKNPAEHTAARIETGMKLVDWGVYSYKTPTTLFYFNKQLLYRSTLLLGKLKNFGHIVEHEYGYRSQIVEVCELFVFLDEDTDKLNSEQYSTLFTGRYGCPVVVIPMSRLDSRLTYYGGDTGNE